MKQPPYTMALQYGISYYIHCQCNPQHNLLAFVKYMLNLQNHREHLPHS